MSLRTDIHAAFDVITPATGGMAERVVETAKREARVRERRRRHMVRLRAPMSLVAIFVLVAIVVALFIGAQAVRSWNAQHSTAPAAPPNSVIAKLEARPITLPLLTAADSCPAHLPDGKTVFDFGSGPVYLTVGDYADRTDWGDYFNVEVFVDRSAQGPILIRGRDLRSGRPVVFTGRFAAGPVLGSDANAGHTWQQHAELVLDLAVAPDVIAGGLPGWKVEPGFYSGTSGCVGFQVDGPSFTETIT